MKLVAVYTTVAETKDVEMLATAAIEQKLAACVQVNQVESFYSWKGSIKKEAEYRLLFKTTVERYTDLQRMINDLHPYDLPAIYALHVGEASPTFESWVAQNTGSSSSAGIDASQETPSK
jgi:periplasmic divalent cation tolerance protein